MISFSSPLPLTRMPSRVNHNPIRFAQDLKTDSPVPTGMTPQHALAFSIAERLPGQFKLATFGHLGVPGSEMALLGRQVADDKELPFDLSEDGKVIVIGGFDSAEEVRNFMNNPSHSGLTGVNQNIKRDEARFIEVDTLGTCQNHPQFAVLAHPVPFFPRR